VPAGEIHELAVTDTSSVAPGERVNRVAYIGFVEVAQGGVILVGDDAAIGDRQLGRVVGFDHTHFPNHMGILIHGSTWQTGRELGVAVEDKVVFAAFGS
jgi:hypothetical protein